MAWLRALAVGLAIYVAGWCFTPGPGHVGLAEGLTAIPSAVALACLLRWGPALWPAPALAILALALTTGQPPGPATALAAGLLFGPLSAAVLLRRLAWDRRLQHSRDIALYLGIGVAAACALSALAAVTWARLYGIAEPNSGAGFWLSMWLHHGVVAIALGVPMLTLGTAQWVSMARAPVSNLGPMLVAAASACAGLAIAQASFAAWPLLFLPHVILGWLAARAGLAVASLGALAVSAASVLAIAMGLGPAFLHVAAPMPDWLWSHVGILCLVPLWIRSLIPPSALGDSLESMPRGKPADITKRPAAGLAGFSGDHVLQQREHLALTLFEHLREGLLITDTEHRVIDANPMFCRITGFGRSELLGTVPALLRPATPGSPAATQQSTMLQSLASTGSWHGMLEGQRRDGAACTLRVAISTIPPRDGPGGCHVLMMSDVTEIRRHTERLQRQARFDELTGLPNRAQLPQMLAEAMRASEREGFLLTVCCLDLDHFKPLNERFGHAAGDRLLVELAQRLRASTTGTATAARLGGDEFVLLLRTATLEEARHAVERLLRHVCEPYTLAGSPEPVIVTASGGATVYPLDPADADTLMRHADHAMYGAKQSGRNGYLFFDAELDRRTEARFEAVARVHEALQRQEFVLYYQPKVDMRKGTVLGVEALLRWRHPQHGVIPPAQFLPLIEHTGLSARLGDWVMQQAIQQLAQWRSLGLEISVSVNVSARHLQEPLFAQRLAELLAPHPAPVAQGIVIEVLETAALADVDYTRELMTQCQAMGVRFALDDFGTGYSTLTYLKRLPVDMLKIDRSFVLNMLDDRQDLAIVENVISLSRTFGCMVIAEGVESDPLAQRLIELGCDTGQGNGIAAAMPADEVRGWVQAWGGAASRTPAVV